MSNWLGFSLTPHLRIDEGFGTTAGRIDDDDDDLDQNQNQNQPTTYNNNTSSSSTAAAHHHHHHHHQNIPVMPLRSDGSLCVLDPFRHHPPDWRYESNMDVGGGSASEEGPKLEDFLGSCYSNSPSDHHNNGINVNVDLVSDMEAAGGEDLGINTSSLNNYQYFIENNNNNNPNPNHHLMMMRDHHVQGFDHESATSSSVGFKSWLSQAAAAPFCDMKSGSTSSNHHQVTNFQSLSLSMSSNPTNNNSHQNGSLMVSPPPPTATTAAATMISPLMQQVVVDNSKKRVGAKSLGRDPAAAAAPRKSIDTFGQRTSQYRGVTRHRWTGRYEAHLWDNSCRKEGQTRKGRQVYLGGYDKEEKAARAYDLAALKYWGPTTHINFPLSSYENELEEMKHMTRQEFVANLRRKSSGFSRGASVYRGVTRHHQHGRWQARIGRVAGNKDLYLGTFSTQEEAAEAYDIAAIKFRGTSAVTNFGISRYDVKRICSSSTLIASDLAKRNSLRDGAPMALDDCASSKSPPQPPVLAITSSEASDELTDMIWSGKGNKHDQQQQQNFDNNDTTLVGSSSRNSSSSESLKCSVGLGNEFGISGGDLPPHQDYFSFQGPKYEDENNQSGNGSSNRNMGGLDLVSQVPMFALWNE